MKKEEPDSLDLRMEQLQSKLDTLYDKFLNENSSSPPSSLFHYTDANGLLGIFDKHKLWATHTAFLNDETETSHIKHQFEEIYHELIDQAEPDDSAKSNINHPLWIYRDFLHRLSYNTLRTKPDHHVYAVSFCGNNDLLSQWQGYGNNGAGYAIGFDTDQFKQLLEDFKFHKVIYCEEKQKQILKDTVSVVIDSLKELIANPGNDSEIDRIEGYASIFEWQVRKYAPFFKHKDFEAENEWRLSYLPPVTDQSDIVMFRNGRFGLTPYAEIEIKIPGNDTLPIISVMSGPTARPSNVLDMMKIKYQDFEILKSNIPLRAG
ncbi:MAG: DUF2971 domain-containing protein [Methylobacter sp.]